jgi:hypothetical protein
MELVGAEVAEPNSRSVRLDHGNGIAATEQSSSKGPLNEAVADVVSTMRRIS